jgi:2-polyprenyl-6-methoxyphenol hydroxylase-like FAD-dependent oxidoreductase
MGASVEGLIEEQGVVRGVRYHTRAGHSTVRAALTVGADGRYSRVRKLAGFTPIQTAPAIDVLWFRLARQTTDRLTSLDARIGRGLFLIFINRFTYWQMGAVIPKGSYRQVRAAGLPAFRQAVAVAAPEVADRVEALQAWQQLAVLSVESSRLKQWSRPGLLLIGDAAHVMSPVGGVGINYAIADAVVASNLLGPRLRAGRPLRAHDLARVPQQREWPTRVIQTFQAFAQRVVMARLRRIDTPEFFTPPWFVRRLLQTPAILTLPAWFIGFGLRAPHVVAGRTQDGDSPARTGDVLRTAARSGGGHAARPGGPRSGPGEIVA